MRFLAPLFMLFLFVGCLTEDATPITVEIGDEVAIEYTGKILGSNLVFDTSIESIARDQGIEKVSWFQLRDKYEPLVFIVGSGQVLPAFEEGLIGASLGSQKTLVLTPEEGYGERNTSNVMTIERFAFVPLIFDVPLDVYQAGTGQEPILNESVQLRYWPARIINVTEENVTLRNMPENNTFVETSYSPARITLNSTHITVELTPPKGFYNTVLGPARAISENHTSIILDYNHPLAGQTLVFEVVVKNITKMQKN